jgi:glucose/arabinose dehydrogenase
MKGRKMKEPELYKLHPAGVTKNAILIIIAIFSLPGPAEAQWPGIEFVPYAAGFSNPVHMTHSGDQSERLFVVEQGGLIKIIKGGTVLSLPFLDIQGRVLSGGERGLLSVAFPPQYGVKQYFYVNYTRNPDGATVISRFSVADNPDLADLQSEEILLIIEQPYANHNGGQLAFSPKDGFLYIGMGDGGSGGDPENYAQNLDELPGNRKLLGKLLRVDVEAGANPYAIPENNPVLNSGRSEIWAMGLRNPWRFSFDRQTGDLYVGDVGQGVREEIDFQSFLSPGGENYGWRIFEGSLCFNPPSACIAPVDYAPPIAEYDHTEGCSVTGGSVYRGSEFPLMEGIYFFGDFCSGRIWGLKRIQGEWVTQLLVDTEMTISTFGEGEKGDLYVANYADGNIYKIVQTGIPELPDLSGEWIDFSSTRQGAIYRVEMTLRISNNGPKKAPRGKVKIYLSGDERFDPGDDTFLKEIQFGPIETLVSRTKSFRARSKTDPSGNYLVAVVDPEDKIDEFDETNNIVSSNEPLP